VTSLAVIDYRGSGDQIDAESLFCLLRDALSKAVRRGRSISAGAFRKLQPDRQFRGEWLHRRVVTTGKRQSKAERLDTGAVGGGRGIAVALVAEATGSDP